MLERLVHGRRATLLAVVLLALPAGAELAQYRRGSSTPGLAAGGLVYAYVPGAAPPASWAEARLEEIRLRGAERPLGEMSWEASYILSALHGTEMHEYELQTEGPIVSDALQPEVDPTMIGSPRLETALRDAGLGLDSLKPRYEVPWLAIAAADFFLQLYNRALQLALTLRSLLWKDVSLPRTTPQIEVDTRFSWERDADGYHGIDVGRIIEEPAKEDQIVYFRQHVARSIFKIALGICLGILLWGFIRNR